jgi:hypothetical protein
VRPKSPIEKLCQFKTTLERGRLVVITGDSMRLGSPIREPCKFDTALER